MKQNRVVKHVRFAKPGFVPDFGEIPDTLPSATKTYESLTMVAMAHGIMVDLQKRLNQGGKKVSVFFPWHNVVSAVLGPAISEEKKPNERSTSASDSDKPATKAS